MASNAQPRAKPGLLMADHSKRGRRFVTVLDDADRRVTLLAPWEHAVLVLCDGTRTAGDIARLLAGGIDAEEVTERGVARCFDLFAREGLVDGVEDAVSVDGWPEPTSAPRPGPRTMANLQQTYREWHKDPEKTGRLLSGLLSPPFLDDPPPFRPSLSPTVALANGEDEASPPVAVGSTLVVGGPGEADSRALRSVLDDHRGAELPSPIAVADEDLTNVAELLAAVDFELGADGAPLSAVGESQETTDRDAQPGPAKAPADSAEPSPAPAKRANAKQNRDVGRAVGGIADLPAAEPTASATLGAALPEIERADTMSAPWSRGQTVAGDLAPPLPADLARPMRSFRHRQVSEAGLTPTLVGQAPPDGDGPPVLVVPPRAGSQSAGARVMATIGPEPEAPEDEREPGATEDTRPVERQRDPANSAD